MSKGRKKMEIYGLDIRGGSSMKGGPWTGGSFLHLRWNFRCKHNYITPIFTYAQPWCRPPRRSILGSGGGGSRPRGWSFGRLGVVFWCDLLPSPPCKQSSELLCYCYLRNSYAIYWYCRIGFLLPCCMLVLSRIAYTPMLYAGVVAHCIFSCVVYWCCCLTCVAVCHFDRGAQRDGAEHGSV
jgi:hypothetical protein